MNTVQVIRQLRCRGVRGDEEVEYDVTEVTVDVTTVSDANLAWALSAFTVENTEGNCPFMTEEKAAAAEWVRRFPNISQLSDAPEWMHDADWYARRIA